MFHDLHVDEYGNRQEPYGCLNYLLYDMRVNFERHVIALVYRYELEIVVDSTWWRQPRRHMVETNMAP